MRGVAAERPRTRCPPPSGPAAQLLHVDMQQVAARRGARSAACGLLTRCRRSRRVETEAPARRKRPERAIPSAQAMRCGPSPCAAAVTAQMPLLERGCGHADLGGWNAEQTCGRGDRPRPPPGSGEPPLGDRRTRNSGSARARNLRLRPAGTRPPEPAPAGCAAESDARYARIHRSKLDGAGCRAGGEFGGCGGARRAVRGGGPERGAVAQRGSGARVTARGCREACAGMLARGLEPARRCERASGRER